MGKVLRGVEVCQLADDALFYTTGSLINEFIERINSNLKTKNKLKLNVSKTKAKFFRRLRKRLSIDSSLRLYNVMIKPNFEYCSTILVLCSTEMRKRLQELQNKGMRSILLCNILTSILDTLKWLNTNQRTVMNVLLSIFKMKHNMLPKYLSRQLIYVGEVQPYNLTNNGDFRINLYRTSRSQNTLLYTGLKLFNQLPNTVKTERNIIIYRRLLVDYIKENIL